DLLDELEAAKKRIAELEEEKETFDGVIVYARTDAGIGVKQQNDAGIKD
ncbi:ead/Ea22-like family protein, partial [Escherichia coli]|nr:ead/Ea22-like family protein [Escherichia coli]